MGTSPPRALALALAPALALVAVVIAVLAVVCGAHIVLPSTAWVGAFELIVTACLLAAAVVTPFAIWRGMTRVGIAIPALLLAANTSFVAGTLFGWKPIAFETFTSDKFVIVLSLGTVLGICGLVMRRPWARWLCLALGAAGFGSGALNASNFWEASGTPYAPNMEWYFGVCRSEWVHLVSTFGGALIIVNLTATRGAFVATEAWSRPEPVMRWLRLTMIASFVAVPMLLVYAWMQPIVPATVTSALVLAATFSVGAVLAVRGKVAGALLLVLSGCGLLVQTLVTALEAGQSLEIAAYYAVFWVPAALTAIVCGALLARPMLRLLRR